MSARDRYENREQIIAAILQGELSPQDDVARAALAEEGIHVDDLAEMQAVIAELEATNLYEQKLLKEADAVQTGPGIDEVESTLRRLQTGKHPKVSKPTPQAPVRLLFPILAAAAALLLVAWLGGWFSSESPIDGSGNNQLLGPTTIQSLLPSGAVDDFGQFSFDTDLAPGGWFEILVYDRDFEPNDPPVASSGDLLVPTWAPDAKVTKEWPEKIHWEVRSYDSSRVVRGFGEADAERPEH